MQRVYDQVARVAPTGVNVLLTGESGTGKEVVAQTIHELSRRRTHPFLAVNCGAISPQLIESELFGHEKGSFTGAMRQHRASSSAPTAARCSSTRSPRCRSTCRSSCCACSRPAPSCGSAPTMLFETDVRIIAATNRKPLEAVQQRQAARGPLYRLNVFPMLLPPLRERLEDVELLAQHFHFTPTGLRRMASYPWPGNVRELRNAVHRAYVMTEGGLISEEWLPQADPDTPMPATGSGRSLSVHVGMSLAEVERMMIYATLDHYGGHKEKTAATLGVSLKTLYNRLKEYAEESARHEASEV
jgi:two-component system, NtrC family, response regulator AtoC